MARILLVDDDAALLRSLLRRFAARGHQVAGASSAAEALAVKESYDLGVFDYRLGDGTGDDVATALHARGVVRLVVFFSTYHVASPLGPSVHKPDVAELERVIDESLGRGDF
jgi:ActR/RegA family two-component response regulator